MEVVMNYQAELNLLQNQVPNIYKKTNQLERVVSYKQRTEVVSTTDLYIEREIIKAIKETFPTDTFHSEEFNQDTTIKERTWVIDPIDGTSNYVHRLPIFVVQIALFEQGEVVLAYVYIPSTGKTLYALKGEGSYLDGKRIMVSETSDQPNRLMTMVGLSHHSKPDKRMFMHLIHFTNKHEIKIRILGSLGYALIGMAWGSFVMLYTDVTNLWDIAPGVLLIQEAGGILTNQLGEPYQLGEGHLFAFCDDDIKNQVIESIKEEEVL